MTGLTHAGGVVYRRRPDGAVEVLLVRASTPPHEWVLPKGHIEQGETPEVTARREVLEESGVGAQVERPLGTTEFAAQGEAVRVAYFLMSYQTSSPPMEDREIRWCSLGRALASTPFENIRDLIRSAGRILDAEDA
jgi:ADP-ribose pyrophosphatase YjhB (NUDIX family)